MLYVRTDKGAPNRKVLAVDLRRIRREGNWKTILPEAKQAIESVTLIGGRIVAQYLVDVQSKIALFGLDGNPQAKSRCRARARVLGIAGAKTVRRFSTPSARRFLRHGVLLRSAIAAIRPRSRPQNRRSTWPQYETKALFATSKDGTRVPLFLTWRKGLALDGSNPTMLYGYGGFSISTLPIVPADVPAWLELGGIWVTANMRGRRGVRRGVARGGEAREKQNVFDDFIAVAEYLVKEKYTSPAKLGIMGGSNGGLLVGA